MLAVDDDLVVLATLEDELRKRYGEDYDVRCEASPAVALRLLQDCKDLGQPVALVLASQWMADILGTDLLGRAHGLHPTAKRGLLISWGDRSAAEPMLQAMAVGQFDYYVPKPSPPPDEGFHSIVEGFLADWAKLHGRGFTPIVLVGDPATTRVHELRDLLTRNGLLHRVHTHDSADAVALFERAGIVPDGRLVVFVLDEPPLIDPSIGDVADALGVNAATLHDDFDVVIVGGGPAGLGAAVYGASEGLRTLVVEREALGGQAGTSSLIRNFLGFPTGVSGSELAIRAYEQAWLFGAKFHFMHEVTDLHPGGPRHRLELSNAATITTRTVVLATGASYRRLGIAPRRAHRRRRVLRGGRRRSTSGHRDESLRRRRRQLRRTSRPPPRQVREPGHSPGTRPAARPEHVRIPDHPDQRHTQHRHQDQHRSRRRRRHPAPPTTHPARHPHHSG